MENKLRFWHGFIHPVLEHFRQKRGRVMLRLFPDIRTFKICDLGGSRHFWDALCIDGINRQNITIYNIASTETRSRNGGDEIKIVIYDGKTIPVPDKTFDLLVCNSVLEHVPPDQREGLAREMRRVSKRLFIQTPAFSFPIEPHFVMPFIHWMPLWLGYRLALVSPWRIMSKPDRNTINEYFFGTQLLGEKEIKRLFSLENVGREKVLGLTKSFYVY